MNRRTRSFIAGTVFALLTPLVAQAGLTPVTDQQWDATAVRKVLHAFAYGGFASDVQIQAWADMTPQAAIEQILTFAPVNPYLSPSEDASSTHGAYLADLQTFWSSNAPDNPTRPDKRRFFPQLNTRPDGTTSSLSAANLQRTWTQAVNTRGINPFRHKMGLYLTNYHMAISISKTRPALMQIFYDDALSALQQNEAGIGNFFDVLAEGATSAAVARAYGHQYNRYVNTGSNPRFIGNDDFAREFHQLFFKIQGTTETGTAEYPGQDYHENVTIEHTAWALTGMNLDREPDAYGSTSTNDWLVAPIHFEDHTDLSGRLLRNYTWHHWDCLEILNSGSGSPNVCGMTAKEKITSLAQVAGYHPESLDNLPLAVVDFFADDNLAADKIAEIRDTWTYQEPKDLLAFLRTYAISTAFHRADTVKFRSAFDRNLALHNMNTLSNQESFARYALLDTQMKVEGAEVFNPAHDVFGGQTGLQAANNPNIFKEAYARSVQNSDFLGAVDITYSDASGVPVTWTKDWAQAVPSTGAGYRVKDIAPWLWDRFVADGGKNLDKIAAAQLHSLLATGTDFGYAVAQQLGTSDPSYTEDRSYSEWEISSKPLKDVDKANWEAQIALDDPDPVVRAEANARIGLAVNFIAAMPYVFALEGE